MNEIYISQFDGYRQEDFVAYLSALEGDIYRLHLPKRAVLYQDDLYEIGAEYARMALMGKKIDDLFGNLVYFVPRMDRNTCFGFQVRTADKESLAGLLVMALDLCDPESAGFEDFNDEAEEMFRNQEQGLRACYEYFVLARLFL